MNRELITTTPVFGGMVGNSDVIRPAESLEVAWQQLVSDFGVTLVHRIYHHHPSKREIWWWEIRRRSVTQRPSASSLSGSAVLLGRANVTFCHA